MEKCKKVLVIVLSSMFVILVIANIVMLYKQEFFGNVGIAILSFPVLAGVLFAVNGMITFITGCVEGVENFLSIGKKISESSIHLQVSYEKKAGSQADLILCNDGSGVAYITKISFCDINRTLIKMPVLFNASQKNCFKDFTQMTDKSKEIKVKPGEKKTLATFLNVEKNVGGALFSDGRLNKLGIYVEGKSAFKQTYAQWYFFDKDVEQHEEYMQEDAKVSNGGMLSHQDIVDAYENKRLRIYPFESEVNGISALQPASYDFAFSSLVMSVQEKKKYELHVRRCLKNLDEEEIYFTLKKGDTAYVLTRECIWVSGQYAGILQSRMGAIAQGLSNISTTLDPGWLGPLLIIVTNNNNQDIDVPIAKRNKKNGEVHYQTFITLSLFQLKTPAAKVSDNNAARLNYLLEILDPTVEENKALRDGLDDLQDSFMNQLKNMFQYGDLLEGPKKNGIYNTCKFVELFDDSQKEVLLQVEQIAPLPFEEECNVIVRTK